MLHKPPAMIARGTTVITMPTRIFFRSSHPSATVISVSPPEFRFTSVRRARSHFVRECKRTGIGGRCRHLLTMQRLLMTLVGVMAHASSEIRDDSSQYLDLPFPARRAYSVRNTDRYRGTIRPSGRASARRAPADRSCRADPQDLLRELHHGLVQRR